MKKVLFICLALLILGACSEKKSKEKKREKLKKEIVSTWESGKPKAVNYFEVVDGKDVKVEAIHYHPNGSVSREETYNTNGLRHGEWKLYYPGGAERAVYSFKEGKRDGKYTTYFESGKPNIEGQYLEGKQTGIWKTFDENGKVKKEENFN